MSSNKAACFRRQTHAELQNHKCNSRSFKKQKYEIENRYYKESEKERMKAKKHQIKQIVKHKGLNKEINNKLEILKNRS